ncbi:hypothetical protein K470DRAFT_259353 [Piedraia hortae CBS 480.64]|uniref:Uncharacterized protein n=1 Tax=Piedraia hortae CBS 480.64 TaxID=1314780 RepID=A0A6A7BU40_9PEZI|nr:hypothetical protein K470DRAFT_259353 [Piedraia hortae CBS 480.64]
MAFLAVCIHSPRAWAITKCYSMKKANLKPNFFTTPGSMMFLAVLSAPRRRKKKNAKPQIADTELCWLSMLRLWM